MASEQAVVSVVDGGSVVEESIRRPIRLTPDGYAGVVYGGAVYPLYRGNVVDVAGSSWEIEDCNRFLLVGAAVPYAEREAQPIAALPKAMTSRWQVETSRFGHYLLFNGSERGAARVVDALEASGLHVQSWDVSHRAAEDGRFYDWFARLAFAGTLDEARALVGSVLEPEGQPQLASVDIDSRDLAQEALQHRVEELSRKCSELERRLSLTESSLASTREDLQRALARETQLGRDLDLSLEQHQVMLRQLRAAGLTKSASADLDLVQRELLQAEEMLELVLSENATFRADVASLIERAERSEAAELVASALAAELQSRIEEVGELERERRRLQTSRRARRGGVPGFLDIALARVTFVLDSLETLEAMNSPSAALRCLVRLDMGEVLGKDLEGLPGWREISKVATGIAGSEDMGRIYYKPDGDRVLVSVDIKRDDKQQRRHVERLRSL